MPIIVVSEDDLRAVLRPNRVDPQAFETEVRARIANPHERAIDPSQVYRRY